MKKLKFVCDSCQAKYSKWQGQCHLCKEWNSIVEIQNSFQSTDSELKVTPLKGIQEKQISELRFSEPSMEKIFNGGLPVNSLSMLFGEPGVGKSSFTSFVINSLKVRTLYVSGEESREQVASRLRKHEVSDEDTYLTVETEVSLLKGILQKIRPKVCIIDSFQTLKLEGESTRSRQVEIINQLSNIANELDIAFWVIGHVNKQGTLAGLKFIEHMVDAVFSLERKTGVNRVLKSSKNRFGSTNINIEYKLNEKGVKLIEEDELEASSYKPVQGRVFFPKFSNKGVRLIQVDSMLKPESNYALKRDVLVGLDLGHFRFLSQVFSKATGKDLKGISSYIRLKNEKLAQTEGEFAVICSLMASLREISFNRKLVVWGEVDISGDVSADNFDSEKIKQVQAFCERENAVLITGDDLTPINQTDFDWRKIKNLSQLESELTSIAS